MARWRFLAVDLVTGTVRDEMPLTVATFGEVLNRSGPFTGEMSPDAPQATRQNVDAVRTVVLCERNGVIVGDGIVWDPRITRDGDDRTLELNGGSLWTYFNHRRLREDRPYVDVDDAEIVADLFRWAQGQGDTAYGSAGDPTGDVRLNTSEVVATGVTSTRRYVGDERKRIGEAIEQRCDLSDGVDAAIKWRWDGDVPVPYLHVWRRRGVRLTDPFELGGNVTSYEFGVAGSLTETHVDGIGQGEGQAMKVATAVDPSAHPAYPRLDGVAMHKDAKDLGTLFGHAKAQLDDRHRPPELVTVTLDPDATPPFGSWQAGDEVRVFIDDGWAQVDAWRRIAGWEMTASQDGSERVRVATVRLGEV